MHPVDETVDVDVAAPRTGEPLAAGLGCLGLDPGMGGQDHPRHQTATPPVLLGADHRGQEQQLGPDRVASAGSRPCLDIGSHRASPGRHVGRQAPCGGKVDGANVDPGPTRRRFLARRRGCSGEFRVLAPGADRPAVPRGPWGAPPGPKAALHGRRRLASTEPGGEAGFLEKGVDRVTVQVARLDDLAGLFRR